MVSFIPIQRRYLLHKKIMGFLTPGSFCHAFSVVSRRKLGIKSIRTGREGPCRRLLLNLFFDFTTAFQDKIKQRERSVLEKWRKDVSCSRIFTKLRESEQKRSIQALRMHTGKNSLRRQTSLLLLPLVTKKQSTKTKKNFSSSKSSFIGKRKLKLKGNSAVYST